MMQLDLFKHLVDEAANIGDVSLLLGIGGESLLHPDFVEMLEYAMSRRSKFCDVGFFTNGTLFDEKVAEAVVRLGVDWVDFSIDGVGEVTERVRRGILSNSPVPETLCEKCKKHVWKPRALTQ